MIHIDVDGGQILWRQKKMDKEEEDDEYCIIEGKDPKRPVAVEGRKIAWPAGGFDEFAGDQEAGKHKKKVYARPAW